MKYIGNYQNWIQQEWVDLILHTNGTARPRDGNTPDSKEMEYEYSRAKQAGYKDTDVYFWMFDKSNVNFILPTPPWVDGKYHWWITKMLPGNFMPMHVDPHTLYEKNSCRYWMPLQDWKPGHVFMYENEVITDYKAGDVWMYRESGALHGAANIGYTPRLVLQVSTYE